jgi:hypothetical protein
MAKLVKAWSESSNEGFCDESAGNFDTRLKIREGVYVV